MPFGIHDLLHLVLIPAAVACVVFLVWRRLGRLAGSSRHAGAHAALAGFLAGYLLLGWTRLKPVEHWEWLPWLAVIAAVSGPFAAAAGAGRFDRLGLRLVVGGVAAWALVPTWSALADVRLAHVAVLAAALAAACLALDGLPDRFTGPLVPALLCASAFAAAALLAHSGSLKFAELGAMAGAALGGSALGAIGRREQPAFRGGTDVFAVLVGGLCYAGWVHSFTAIPTVSYVLPAVAPLGLWACAAGPVARLPGAWKTATRIAAVVVPLAAAIGLAAWMEPFTD